MGFVVLTRKIGSNQVRAIRINVSGTHEDMKRIEKEGRLDEWCADNLKCFADTFRKENIVAAHLHRDEETPHIHVTLVPIVKGERKRRKREEQTKKRYRKKPTDTVRLCADDIMTRLKLKSYQDTYAEAMAKYGLQRGKTARRLATRPRSSIIGIYRNSPTTSKRKWWTCNSKKKRHGRN